MTTKTTQKDLYTRIATFMAEDPEVVEFCNKKIAQIERAAARPRKTKVNEELEAFRTDVFDALNAKTEPVTNKEMAAEFGCSSQKMAAAIRYFEKAGRVTRIKNEKKSGPDFFVVADEVAEVAEN